MPKTTVTQNLKTDVQLKPSLKIAVLKKLRVYEQIHAQEKKAKADKAIIVKDIEELFADAGEYQLLVEGVKVDEFPLKLVQGETSTLDKDYMLKAGWVTLAQLKEATDIKPKKAYLGVTVPKTKGEDDDE